MKRRPVTVERIVDASPSCPIRSLLWLRRPVGCFRVRDHPVMDMVIFRTIFFELLVFFTFMILTLHFAY